MSVFPSEGDYSGSSVLHALEFVEFLVRKASEKRVTIVQSRTDESVYQLLGVGRIEVSSAVGSRG